MLVDRLGGGELALGCEPLGGTDWGTVDLDEARAAVRRAWDLGITVFDTADVYGLGRSEQELAAALGRHRHEAIIVTKFGVRWEAGTEGRARTWRDASPAYVEAAAEASLRRLDVECLPVYLVHWPDESTPLDDTLAALDRLRAAGKVAYYGLSNVDASALADAAGRWPVGVVEAGHSLIDPASGAKLLIEAGHRGVTRLGYGALAQGILTGKFDEASRFGDDDRRSRLPHFAPEAWTRNERILAAVREVAAGRGVTPAQVALRWTLDGGLLDVAIAGARTPAQVEANAAARGWTLDPDERSRLDAAATLDTLD